MTTLYKAAEKLKGAIIHTDGKGLWSSEKRATKIKRIHIEETSGHEDDAGEILLNVFLTKQSWDTDKHGLVYTDKLWLHDIRHAFDDAGYDQWKMIDYTEQGMQGSNYVSLIVGNW